MSALTVANKQSAKNLPGPGPGRPKGSVNKTTATLKEAILQAAELAGGEGGLVAYLKKQALDEPVAFMGMLGKTLPTKVEGELNGNLTLTVETGVPRG